MGKNAIILVNKGQGITSFDCLGRIKRLVNKKTGHCGTLDKFAHGLMIVLCGSYTKLVPVFMGMDKTYEAVIEFGLSTDTLDPEGAVIENGKIPDFETVQNAVNKLIGPLSQIPPAYSAIHVNGKRVYKMARANEEVPQLKPRSVFIHEATIISYEAPFLRIKLHVSKGTYVRAYARDLGHLCSSCAYVKELYRTSIGPFDVNNAIPYDDDDSLKAISLAKEDNLDLLSKIAGTVFIQTNDLESFKLKNGAIPQSVKKRLPQESNGFAIFTNGSKAFCIYSLKEKKIICQIREDE